MIARDFDFRGISAANRLSEFRDHETGRGAAGTTRTKRAHSSPMETTGTDEAEEWNPITETGIITGSEPCIRAHIPNLLNSHVGTEYRTLIGQARLIDKGPFWVEVTP
jgi:hypothetical protein